MATTWMKALHRGGRPIEYINNPKKTDKGILIDGYECEPFTAQSEFLLSKQQYMQNTGRDQGSHDVTAYHMRMSFKPGETTAQQVLEMGRELALRWTKGNHQFIVASHTNTRNPHAHIIFNSVNLDCDGKFNDFKRSDIALRRVSDLLCLERGLSVIEKPALSKGYNRDEYLGEKKPPTFREQLRNSIDRAIIGSNSFDDFLTQMEEQGVEIKHGKQLAFKLSESKKFCRIDTLGDDYSADAINERIAGKLLLPEPKTNLLIEIQERIQQSYGITDLREISKTLLFLKDNGITTQELLTEKIETVCDAFHNHNERRKEVEARLGEIDSLRNSIGRYRETRDTFRQYINSGKEERFYARYRPEIDSHRTARRELKALGIENLPTMDSLRKEQVALEAERRTLVQVFKPERNEMIAFLRAKHNVDNFLKEPGIHRTKSLERDER